MQTSEQTEAVPVRVAHDGDLSTAVCGALCSRRAALAALATAGAAVLLGACSSDGATPPAAAGAVTITAAQVVIQLDLLNGLRSPGSAYLVGGLNLIVIRLAGDEYRTFSNVCTHSGCGISVFETQRLKCQCHGSEFDIDGRNVAGPAPSPLQQFVTTLNGSSRTLVIQRLG